MARCRVIAAAAVETLALGRYACVIIKPSQICNLFVMIHH
jgi:hypothetical protein